MESNDKEPENEINYKAEHLLFSLSDPLSDRIALSLAMSGGEKD